MCKKIKRQFWGVASAICLLFLSMVPCRTVAQTPYYSFADVDRDGTISISDLTLVIDCILDDSHPDGVVSNPNTGYLSAKEYGAVGDGVTDDTDALERLFADAFQQKRAAFFDPGTYLIRRSLTLRTGMEIYGRDATITKAKAVVSSLTATAAKGQTYIDVKNAVNFKVGDQFFICHESQANLCTYGIIDSIAQNRIYFTNIFSDVQLNFPGCVKEHASGAKVATSFALLRSWSPRFDCDGVYIHDLTLDGNRTSSEPKSWANSCIHLDAYYPGGYTNSTTGVDYRHPQRNMVLRNLDIRNSPHDAVSDQGESGLVVTDCVISNSAMHGVHLGTRYFNALISNNKMTGNGSIGAGVFFCQDVSDVVVDNNEITAFNHGCSDEEYATCVKYVIIRNNRFYNIASYVFDFLAAISSNHGTGIQVYNNTVEGLKSYLLAGDYLDNVMVTNNVVNSVTTVASRLIHVIQSKNVVITGNTVPSDVTYSTPVNSTNTTNLIDAANSWN